MLKRRERFLMSKINGAYLRMHDNDSVLYREKEKELILILLNMQFLNRDAFLVKRELPYIA